LWSIDWQRPRNGAIAPPIEPVWFSDGGLSSNFPIALFDAALPRWPTLAITLEEYPPYPTQPVVMPMKNGDFIGSIWTRFDQAVRPANFAGFYGAIINALQNWQDTMQAESPGFRDRIAHIRLRPDQGGLNLTMPPDVINELIDLGSNAGAQLVEHFRDRAVRPATFQTDWENHRFVRYRALMAALQPYTNQFEDAWNSTLSIKNYTQIVMQPPSYARGFAKALAFAATASLLAVSGPTRNANPSLVDGAPKPENILRLRPKL